MSRKKIDNFVGINPTTYKKFLDDVLEGNELLPSTGVESSFEIFFISLKFYAYSML